jgi:diguanylate cyclase (GGDEF)-like protein
MTATTFITARPSRRSIATAAAIGASLLVACVLTLSVARTDLPHIPELLVAYDAALIILNFMTAYLLFSQFLVSGMLSVAILATAFLTFGLMVIVNVLCFPGVFLRMGFMRVEPASPIWVWLICHVMFPALVCVYALVDWLKISTKPRKIAGTAVALWAGSVAAALAVFALVTAGIDLLPPLMITRNSMDLYLSGLGPAAWALNFVALCLILFCLRCRSLVQLWVAVAVLASLLDMSVTLYAPQRYSAGWYLSRVISLLASGVVLGAMLREMTLLYAQIAGLNDRLEEAAVTDGLTGLANRRHFNVTLNREWRRARRSQQKISLLMIDIDWFKDYNDRFGHLGGDDCICRVAMAIGCFARRPTDFAARYGGEEFAVILPETDEAGAVAVAHHIREGVAAMGIPHPGYGGGRVSVSVGVATLQPVADEGETALIAAADEALYRAKRAGRNQVGVHTADGTDAPAAAGAGAA